MNRGARFAAWVASMLAVCLAAAAPSTAAQMPSRSLQFRDLEIVVRGQGRPLLMIPGLGSSAGVWDDTCARLQPGVQCLMVGLPGFAGVRPVRAERYLEAMRDELLAFLKSRGSARTAVIGHSLGGVLGLMMAVKDDASIDRLVIVDALPFLPALQDPRATAASAAAGAALAREAILAATPAAYEAQSRATFPHLVHDAARVDTLVEWSRTSDRATLAQATEELMTTDLRDALPRAGRPTLVLGAWAGLAPWGFTRAIVEARFAQQYAQLRGTGMAFSDAGFHFLMWDDAAWLEARLRAFLSH